MLSLYDRAALVIDEAWRLLPPIKATAVISGIALEDLGQHNGSYNPDTHLITLNERLFWGQDPSHLIMIDVQGNCPPQTWPVCSRALHTTIHEIAHAIGDATGLDTTPEWLALSGWEQAETLPAGTAHYVERRPGWPWEVADWRYRLGGVWFARPYSTKSPQEDFGDCVAHACLGWFDFAMHPNGQAKLAYLRRYVWDEHGPRALAATRSRWTARLASIHAAVAARRRPPAPQALMHRLAPYENAITNTLAAWNTEEREHVVAALSTPGMVPVGQTTDQEERVRHRLGPLLLAVFLSEWRRHGGQGTPPDATFGPGLAHLDRAVHSYVETTQRWLEAALAKADAEEASPSRRIALVTDVYDRSTTQRAKLLAAAEAHRMAQTALIEAWRSQGMVTGYRWVAMVEDTVTPPCPWCTALHGTIVSVGEPFAEEGATLTDARNKPMAIDYGDLMSPPLHPQCRCWLEPIES